jgi:SAM-dependent methyltransferase
MGVAPDTGTAQPPKPPFKARFRAWWDGTESPMPEATSAAAPVAAPAPAPAAAVATLDLPAIKVTQEIWGEGFDRPGGAAFILTLVKPFALNPSMTVMDFGAGLGGSTRAISSEFGVWVHGFEPDLARAAGAHELSVKRGMKKAEIKPYTPQDFLPKPATYDCIFSGETLHTSPEAEKLLGTFERALKARGQLAIADFVRAPGVAADDPRLAGFASRSGKANHFWSDEDYQKRMKGLKFDVRVDEDLTDTYRSMVIEAWVNFTQSGGSAACAKAYPDELVAEVTFWTQRMAALDSGAVRLKRYYAIKMGSGKPAT